MLSVFERHLDIKSDSMTNEEIMRVVKPAVCSRLKSPASAQFPVDLISIVGDDVRGCRVSGFVTAITRAKNILKIYWSPETEQSVLGRLVIKNSNKDAYLLAQLSSLQIL